MNYLKNILKISLVLLLLLVCVGSIYAAEDTQSDLDDDYGEEDFELDEDSDDFEDEYDLDDEYEDEEDFEDEYDLDDEYEEDDSEDEYDLDDEYEDEDDSDLNLSDFDFLKLKITYYLDRYGNCSDHDWMEHEEFLAEYQIYLANPSNYTLNESSEGYKTYLKIYDSITSTFKDYNLTENETDYLKFMVIYYLNHYGNVSANYTWNESESFENFTLPKDLLLGAIYTDIAMGCAAQIHYEAYGYSNQFNPFYESFTNSNYVNQTSTDNQTSVEAPHSGDANIFILILVIVIMIVLVL